MIPVSSLSLHSVTSQSYHVTNRPAVGNPNRSRSLLYVRMTSPTVLDCKQGSQPALLTAQLRES